MGESIDVWREFFRTTTDTNVFEFIHKAITIVALDCPKDFLERRGRIAELLFSFQSTEANGDCTLKSKESKANGDNRSNAAHDVVRVNCSHGEAKTFSDDIQEASQVVEEILRIKRVLDNSRHESDLALGESLKRLQSMTITADILEKTKIGISVNKLRRNCRSKLIAQLAHNITMGWKALVEEICCSTDRRTEDVADPRKVGDGTSSVTSRNIRKPGQGIVKKHQGIVKHSTSLNNNRRTIPVSVVAPRKLEKEKMLQSQNSNGSIAGCKRPFAIEKDKINCSNKGIVKPNMSSNTDSRTTTANKVASWKFDKERMLRSQDSYESVVGCKRPIASQQDVIKCWNEVVADMKFAATKRKIHELYQKSESDKRRRTAQILDPRDLPKMAASRKAPRSATKKPCWQRVISRSQVSCV